MERLILILRGAYWHLAAFSAELIDRRELQTDRNISGLSQASYPFC